MRPTQPRPSSGHRTLLLVAAAVWAALVALVAVRAWGRALDDFFITYRYAANLAAGRGFAFNPGEHAFGTTAPGFAVVLAALHAVTRISIPGLGTLSTGLALWGIALLLLDELARGGRAVEGVVGGTLLVLSSYVWPQHGSEIPFALALLLLSVRLGGARPASAALLAALACWCRPESLLGALGFAMLERRRTGRLPRRFLATLAGGGAAALVVDRLALGTWIPVTLAAKRAQAAWLPGIFHGGADFWPQALRRMAEVGFGPVTALILALGIAGLPLLWRRGGNSTRTLVLHAGALAVAYPALGVAEYPWYVIPVVVALTASAAVAAGGLVRTLNRDDGVPAPRRRRVHLAPLIGAVGLLLPLVQVLPGRWRDTWSVLSPNPHYELYRRTGEWLQQNTPPQATIGYVEVGTIAYFSDRSVQDFLGLVTPRAIPFVAVGDMAGAFLTAPPDYLLFDRGLIGFIDPIRQSPWFADAYRLTARLEASPPSDERIAVYARRPGAVLPPPRPPLHAPPAS